MAQTNGRGATRTGQAALYLRVSTDEQRERQSISTQREFAERYCQLQNIPIHRYFADDGVSGTIALEGRPEAKTMLEHARAGAFDQLLVYRLDRLGRDTRLILNAVAELEKYGVRVRSMTEEFDTATSTGRLMLTLLSGFAAHERDCIRERSMAGTNRVAATGAWLGGIVPYGYRKVGEKGTARLVLSEELIPGLDLSEADVIRCIYRMATVEKKSCFAIADHLNALGVPCAYVRDGRKLLRGKRKERTSGLWRPGRVRNLIVNTTYMGKHEYGKRTKNPGRELIVRDVQAIVDEATWKKAQEVLKRNRLVSDRNATRKYLLRGLIKCGLCNLTYVGMVNNRRKNNDVLVYYRCDGKQNGRGLYGARGLRCPSKDIRGEGLEELIWADVEEFLRNPGPVLQQLHGQLAGAGSHPATKLDRAHLGASLKVKGDERARVVALFRRSRISEAELDSQLDEISAEEDGLKRSLAELDGDAQAAARTDDYLSSAGALLAELRARLDEGVSFELKRALIEILVGQIRVECAHKESKERPVVRITYRFIETTGARTDTRAVINCY
jgi:site-specific DNA recombinase